MGQIQIQIQIQGFSNGSLVFAGWKAHRDYDDAWFVIDSAGNGRWATLEGGELPEGWSFYRYVDGGKVSGTAPSGTVDFYATWKEPALSISQIIGELVFPIR